MFTITPPQTKTPATLLIVLGIIAIIWALANTGYYYILPALGYSLDYNISPIPIALYFLLWTIVSIFYFIKLFRQWLVFDYHIWIYGLTSLACAGLIVALLQIFAKFPSLYGPTLAPFTDILFATPWYFLPKAVEIWLQQILIVILILELHFRYQSIYKVILGYALCFGGIHIAFFAVSEAPTTFASIMTIGAVTSALIFPYLILKVRGGFVFAYVIHLVFYILLAMFLHSWPPPGFNTFTF